jgi:hypothetical protein
MIKLVVCAGLLWAATAVAQEPARCKSFYPVGDPTPAGCIKKFDQWGSGSSVQPSDRTPPATIEDNARTFGLRELPPSWGWRTRRLD